MKVRVAASVLLVILLAGAGAAGAAGQDRRTPPLPGELWDPPGPEAAPADSADREDLATTLALTALAFGAAAVGGFLLTGMRGPAPEPAPLPPPPRPVARSRAPRFQGCSIALARSSTTSQFRVVVGTGADRRVVGRSQRFPAPRSGRLPDEGAARAAFDELVGRLEAVGWQQAGNESGVWHRMQLVRPRPDESAPPVERAIVDAFGDGFAAFAFDDYGNRLRLAERPVGIDQSPEEAHAALLADLEADGWHVAGEGDAWFATTLTRRGLSLVT
jgi:hypothetical protein